MKLLVLGAGGQVGHELCRLAWPADWKLAAFNHGALDITERDAVGAAMARERPDIVINAAAYTAVDRAETEREAAWAGNCTGPANLAAACRDAAIPLIHISTDYVFDGSKAGPYREDDPVKPLGVYGESKEAGERAVREALARHVILRTAWVYSAHGNNFVKTMLRLAGDRPVLRVVADQIGSPTSAADIAAAIRDIVKQLNTGNRSWGTYHFAGGGTATWHHFAEAIFALATRWRGSPPRVEAITTADYPTPARRPANSVLDCSRIGEVFGIVPRPWREALAEVIRELYGSPDDELSRVADQRPAAYRFRLDDGRIDVVSERASAIDTAFALETYRELLNKADVLHQRLTQTNSARRVNDSIKQLLEALGTRFEDLRPGVLLSRERSIEADRAAFDNTKLRGELFPDAISMLDDTLQTLRDLLGAFPIVRLIETERLALELDRSAQAIPAIRRQMAAIKEAAGDSGAATDKAVDALGYNEAMIENAEDPLVRTDLVADDLLVMRNFGGVIINGLITAGRELGAVGGKSWDEIRRELPKGVGAAARVAPLLSLFTLVGWIVGPVIAIASAAPAFRSIARALKSLAPGDVPNQEPGPVGRQAGVSRPGKRPRSRRK